MSQKNQEQINATGIKRKPGNLFCEIKGKWLIILK